MTTKLFILLWAIAFTLIAAIVVNADAIAIEQTLQAGSAVQIALEIKNDTSMNHDYAFSITGFPSGVTSRFAQNGTVAERVALAANSAKTVVLRLTTAPETAVGQYVGEINAARDDGFSVTMPLVLNVENTYALQIVSQTLNATTFSGQEFTFNVTGLNAGAAAITNAALRLDLPARWIAQIEPQSSAQVEPGAQVEYTIRITVPATQAALDQPLTFAWVSDQAISADASLMVRVQDNPNFLPIAAGIGVLAILGVFFYFRKQGRR